MGNKTKNISKKKPLYSKTFWRNNPWLTRPHFLAGGFRSLPPALVEPEPSQRPLLSVNQRWAVVRLFQFDWIFFFSGRVVTVHTVGSLEPTYTRSNFNTELASSWWYENFAWRCPLQLFFNHFKVLSSNFSQDIWPISNPKNVSASAPKNRLICFSVPSYRGFEGHFS